MTKKKNTQVQVSQEENAQAQHMLEGYHQIAHSLHEATDQPRAEAALADINAMPEAAQIALLKLLSKERDIDAADVLLAVNELSPNKAVRKEARRSLIRLEGVRMYPLWRLPFAQAPAITIDTQPAHFWRGIVSDTINVGEVSLMLCWEQENGQIRLMSFLLELQHEGVKDFFTEVSSKHHIEEHLDELQARIETKECTLAEGRRLLQEALDVNKQHRTTPHADYRHNLSLIKRMVMDAPGDEEDYGTALVKHDLTPEQVITDFLEALTSGRYSRAYNLLSSESPVRDGLTRPDWVKQRETWAQAAQPGNFKPGYITEREQQKSGLWLPNPFAGKRLPTRKELEALWSLELKDTPLSEELKELPTATAIYAETQRHWFWNSYVFVQEEEEWRIQDIIDETANARQLSIQELEKRIKELDKGLEEFSKRLKPTEADANERYDELYRGSMRIINYHDALIEKLPLDSSLFAGPIAPLIILKDYERALVYLEALLQHNPDKRGLLLAQIGAAQLQVAESYEDAESYKNYDANRAAHFMQLAEVSLRTSLDLEDKPLVSLALAELLIKKADHEQDSADTTEADALLDEAEEHLHHASALPLAQEHLTAIENKLAELAADRERYEEAIQRYQRLIEKEPTDEELWFHLGDTYRNAENFAEAEASFKRALELDPDFLDVYPALSGIYIHNNEFEKALEIMEEGLRLHPESADLRISLAPIVAQNGDYQRAETLLDEAERIDPDSPMLFINRLLVDATKHMQHALPKSTQSTQNASVSNKPRQAQNLSTGRGKKRRKR